MEIGTMITDIFLLNLVWFIAVVLSFLVEFERTSKKINGTLLGALMGVWLYITILSIPAYLTYLVLR